MAGSKDWIVSFKRCEKLIAARMGTTVRRVMSTRLPAGADRVPKPAANERTHADQCGDARREVGIDHQDQASDEMRPPGLFLAVYEQDKADPAGYQRQEQPRAIEFHALFRRQLLRVERVVQRPPGGIAGVLVPDPLRVTQHHRASSRLVAVRRPCRQALAVRSPRAREVHEVRRHDVGQLALAFGCRGELRRADVGYTRTAFRLLKTYGISAVCVARRFGLPGSTGGSCVK